MILQSLIAYAERENLGDPDFNQVDMRWLIPLNIAGDLVGGPIALTEILHGKARARKMQRPFTSPNELNQGTKSHFLADTLERTVLFLDLKTTEKKQARNAQHAYFKSLLIEAVACTDEADRLAAVVTFLEKPESVARLHQYLAELKAKPTDNATFSVEGVNLLDMESLKRFWRERRLKNTTVRTRRICIATGILTETVDTTEKIKGVPKGLATGTNLISQHEPSFCHFGLKQAQNAALSVSSELKIRSALNSLIENSRKQGLVFNDTVYLHWTRKPVEFDPFDVVASGDENMIEQLLKSVQNGQSIAGLDANAYYALSLSGNLGRCAVRDWIDSTVPVVERNIAEWFNDLAIISQEDGTHIKRDFKFSALLYGMVRAKLMVPDELKELSPQIPALLLHAAIRNGQLPRTALVAALRRQQCDQDKLRVARLALIKACLMRLPNEASTKKENMTESLNLNSHEPSYLCGRLLAVFDRLQYLALGPLNTGVVKRFYASASTTPSLVMGRLFRNAQFHLAKAGGGIAGNAGKDLEEITCALGDKFPTLLTLEEQGRFALGYYHQKAEYVRRSTERKKNNKETNQKEIAI